jgi:hypothetical protein
MRAARQQDPEALRCAYASVAEIVLSIDGLPPEKGHEALDVVRELTQKRVWFAAALISATAAEVQQLIATAKVWAQRLDKKVVLWISDKQDAFVTGIAAEFPGVPHRYCDNHFLRDVAKPVLEADSHAKVPMRQRVRGLRGLERSVLSRRRGTAQVSTPEPIGTETNAPVPMLAVPHDPAGDVVLDYCAVVRGLLNHDQGGPLHPPGLQMASALGEVRESIQRNLEAQKGGVPNSHSVAWPTASTGDWSRSKASKRRSENTSRTSRRSRRPSNLERRVERIARRSSKR